MELVNSTTDNVWITQTIITGILIPLLIIIMNDIVSIFFDKIYLHTQVKNKYKAFLIKHSRSVDDLCYTLHRYKYDTSVFIRCIFFIEGSFGGIICCTQLANLFLYISELHGFNTLFPFLYYYNSHNNIIIYTAHIDLLYSVASFNIFSIIISLLILILMFFFDIKHYHIPQFKETFILTKLSRFCYHCYFFLMGVLSGVNFLILLFTIGALANFHSINQSLSFSLTCFRDIWTNLKIQIPIEEVYFIILLYLLGIIVSVRIIILLYQMSKSFAINFMKTVTDFYTNKLPYLLIKTECGDIKGHLIEIQNKTLITLNEDETLKAVPWDQIKVIEMKIPEENSKINVGILP